MALHDVDIKKGNSFKTSRNNVGCFSNLDNISLKPSDFHWGSEGNKNYRTKGDRQTKKRQTILYETEETTQREGIILNVIISQRNNMLDMTKVSRFQFALTASHSIKTIKNLKITWIFSHICYW